jgi:hypothetical protein
LILDGASSSSYLSNENIKKDKLIDIAKIPMAISLLTGTFGAANIYFDVRHQMLNP